MNYIVTNIVIIIVIIIGTILGLGDLRTAYCAQHIICYNFFKENLLWKSIIETVSGGSKNN